MEPKKKKPADNKTKVNNASVLDFINALADAQQKEDSLVILRMMEQITGEKPEMWGSALIGFGRVQITSPASGRVVDWFRIGFSPRKTSLSLYAAGNAQKHAAALEKLGKHKTGVGCLYIKRLSDVNLEVLRGILENSVRQV